jgi:hypothetical protein
MYWTSTQTLKRRVKLQPSTFDCRIQAGHLVVDGFRACHGQEGL